MLDPLKSFIDEQLRADPRIPSKRLRELAQELGYRGGKTIFDDYVREVRPRFLSRRTYQRTVYRPGELLVTSSSRGSRSSSATASCAAAMW